MKKFIANITSRDFAQKTPTRDASAEIGAITLHQPPNESCWSRLPVDVNRLIFKEVGQDLVVLYRSRRVCKDWKKVIEDFQSFWELQAKYWIIHSTFSLIRKVKYITRKSPGGAVMDYCINYYKAVLYDNAIRYFTSGVLIISKDPT
jgi:hypothetical protein